MDALNRIVTIYLEFAELQALNRNPMYMKDWIVKLDDFLRISDREILTHAGQISHNEAVEKARHEYDRFKSLRLNDLTPVEHDFEIAVKKLKRLKNQNEKSKKE